jgi:hypothetical protein
MTLQTLGSRTVTAAIDTGRNTGLWTAVFNDQILAINENPFEIYHIYIATTQLLNWSAVPLFGQFQVWINGNPWDNVPFTANNSWDPSQPMILHPGDEVDFYFSFSTTPAPIVTAWLRYNDGE